MVDAGPAFGAWGPRELAMLTGAYRAILQEICDTGTLAAIARLPLPAREVRRLAAREVFAAAAIGLRTHNDLVEHALARIMATRIASSNEPRDMDAAPAAA